jgi:hypothetical protein
MDKSLVPRIQAAANNFVHCAVPRTSSAIASLRRSGELIKLFPGKLGLGRLRQFSNRRACRYGFSCLSDGERGIEHIEGLRPGGTGAKKGKGDNERIGERSTVCQRLTSIDAISRKIIQIGLSSEVNTNQSRFGAGGVKSRLEYTPGSK